MNHGNCKIGNCKKYKNIAIAAIAVLAIIIIIVGEKPRKTEPNKTETQAQTEKPTLNKPEEFTQAEKNDTDKMLNTTSLAPNEKTLKATEAPENQQPENWNKPQEPENQQPIISDKFKGQPDKIKPAIAKAIEIQSKNPGRYQSQTITGSGEIFAIDSTTGTLWLLRKTDENWQNLGKPAGMTSGPSGTYMLAGADTDQATVMNTVNAITWRVTLVNGKPEWKEISGPQSDQSWK